MNTRTLKYVLNKTDVKTIETAAIQTITLVANRTVDDKQQIMTIEMFV